MPEFLRVYRKSILAVLLFVGYALLLFWNNFQVNKRLEQDMLNESRLELTKQAETTSYFFAERRNDLADLAESTEISSYFANVDIGMTIDYGLGVSIDEIAAKFEHLIEQKKLGSQAIYRSFALFDTQGQLIAKAGGDDMGTEFTQLRPILRGEAGVQLLPGRKEVLFTAPVVFKNRTRGQILASGDIASIESRFSGYRADRLIAMVVTRNGEPMWAERIELFSGQVLRAVLANMPDHGTQIIADLPQDSSASLIAAIKVNVAGSPLSMVQLVSAEDLSRRSIPAFFLIAAGTVPFIVIFMVFVDLRERRKSELANQVARAEAERLARVRSEFLANMSHEIRTPLNAILGLAQVGERQSRGRQTAHIYGRILDSGKHLLGIINGVLDFSKIEAGKLVLEQTRTELGAVIDQAIVLTAARAYAKKLQFLVCEENLPRFCRCDLLRLSQVLVNLLGNAIKFTDAGAVTLVAKADGAMLEFTVTDTGIGMTPEQVGRLFSPFEQADGSTTRRFGGSGLGLSIAARLVSAMGGNISVSSEIGKSSTFRVRVPLVAPEFDSTELPKGRIAVVQLPEHDAQGFIAGLANLELTALVCDIETIPTDTSLILVDAGLAYRDAAVALKLNQLEAAGSHIVVLADPEETGNNSVTTPRGRRWSVIERPIRVRHVLATMRQEEIAIPRDQVGGRLVGVSILAAEDNEVNQLVLVDLLRMEGARIECVDNGQIALQTLLVKGTEAFDLVLTDIQMPIMDGYELSRRLRSMNVSLPVIGLTAHAMPEERMTCLEAGMVEHVTKPIDLDALVAVILKYCNKPEAERRALAASNEPMTAHGAKSNGASPIIDWEILEARFGRKREFVTRLASRALESYRPATIRLRSLAAEGDILGIAALAHSIKGTSGTLGINGLQAIADLTDLAARGQSKDALNFAIELADTLDEVIGALAERVEECS